MKLSDKEIITVAREYKNKPGLAWEQFRSCQAHISEPLYDRWILIKSYCTIVGVIDLWNFEFYEIGKYSRTTSKQVTMIYNAYYRTLNRNYIEGRV